MRNRWLAAITLVLFTVAIVAATAAIAFAVPANDNFLLAQPITNVSGTDAKSNVGATIEESEVRPENNTRSIWYLYTAVSNDVISFDTVGSVDPVPDPDEPIALEVRVYTGATVSTLVQLPASYVSGDLSPAGHVEFPVTSGQPYYIQVTSPAMAGAGNTVLNWQTKGYTGHITGTVTATNGGTALAGMQVDAYAVGGTGKPLRTVNTLANGTYDLMGLGTDNYHVKFSDPAPTTYLTEWFDNTNTPASYTQVPVTNGATTSGRNAVLDRASSISGNVKSNGVNTPNVIVQLLPYAGDTPVPAGSVQRMTDASGNYSFTGLPPRVGAGNYYIVQFIAPVGSGFSTQFYNKQSSIALAQHLQPVEGTIFTAINCTWPTPGVGTLSGTVTASGGGALSDVTVSVAGSGSTTTAGNGAYSIGSIPSGTYNVTYSKAGYTNQTINNVVITTGATTTRNVSMVVLPGTLSGTVTASGGGALSGVTVTASGSGGSTTTGAGGTYSIASIPPGTYSVTYSKAGYTSQTINNVVITTNATTTQNVSLVILPGILSGTVSSSLGGTLSGVHVSVSGSGGTADTAVNGTYSIGSIPPGTYSVTYSKTGYASQTINNVVITTNATTTQNVLLVAVPGTLSGTVTDQNGGGNLSGVHVSVSGSGGTADTAVNGTYSIGSIPPGTSYSVTYSKDGYTGQTINGVVITAGGTTTQNVVLAPVPVGTLPGTLTGTVSSSLGGTLSGVTVSVSGTGTVTTNGSGVYTVGGITPGNYNVTYSKANFTPRTLPGVLVESDKTAVQNVTLVSLVAAPKTNVYRFRNRGNGFYLWSADETEKAFIMANLSASWDYEGVAYTRNTVSNTAPLWRFVNLNGGYYLYTADPSEKDFIITNYAATWKYEGPAYNVSRDPSGRNVWRFVNLQDGTYLLSADPAEKDSIVANLSATWKLEGPAFFLAP